ncbi:hypothetical protein C3F34_13975 [Acinetobacter sp. ACNIH2]|uniref:hypothetical protein n=1 Tax=Acinetobacter sp. ACNIH2 TaxID=1758189 RepID=UPI000CDC3FE1|nr:hypothetical protein [Acinetobacter sp. ACNIH2]AUX87030.1 hypothetical protein C3F34_13975 [Acinetobacter sp. ACNIH2]
MNLRHPKIRSRFKPGQIVRLDGWAYSVAATMHIDNCEIVHVCAKFRWSFGPDISARTVTAKQLVLMRGVA